MVVDDHHAAHWAEAQVAQFKLAGDRCGVAAAQYRAQAGGQFPRITGLGQVIVCAQLQAQNPVQRLAACRQHQHWQVGMVGAQLLEQLQAAAIGQHHIQHHGGRRGLRQCLAGAVAIVAGLNLKAFLAQPTAQKLAELHIIINQ